MANPSCTRRLCLLLHLIAISIPAVLIYVISASPSPPSSLKPCNYSAQLCGNLTIPFPFGMSPECGLPEYRVSCKKNASYGHGYLAFLQNMPSPAELQILSFVDNSTLLVNATELKAMPSPDNCLNESYFAEMLLQLPPDGPFVLSNDNYFAVIGCRSQGRCDFSEHTVSDMDSSESQYSSVSCDTGCYNQESFDFCNYYSCCVQGIVRGTRGLRLMGNGISYAEFPDVCGFSTIINPSSYSRTKDIGVFADGHYGILLSWGLKLNSSSQNCTNIRSESSSYACVDDARCNDVSFVFEGSPYAYTCSCPPGFSGDGYRDGLGCQDIDECSAKELNTCVLEPAGRCLNSVGSYKCQCNEGYTGDGNRTSGSGCRDINECETSDNDCEREPLGECINTEGSFECVCKSGSVGNGKRGSCSLPRPNESNIGLMPILVGIGCVAILVVLSLVGYGWRRSHLTRRRRSENFRRNGGEELTLERCVLFREEELIEATNSFCRQRELGKGGFGTVYWGMLPQPHGKVAIKKVKHMDDGERERERVEPLLAEISALGKVKHPNVVRLLGCCVETTVPLLVYEFVENGSVWDHLHASRYKENSPLSRNWARRLGIAIGTAAALSHLHSMKPPIIHRDVKSANILLDRSYFPKVADFGASCFLATGATHRTFAPEDAVGTPGYIDPEYHRTLRVTDRSDVYSFGVVLLELVTSKTPDMGPLLGFLVHYFKELYRTGRVEDIIDSGLVESDADGAIMASIREVAELAMGCLAMEGCERPTMEEVWQSLERNQRMRKLRITTVEEADSTEYDGNDEKKIDEDMVAAAEAGSVELAEAAEHRSPEIETLLLLNPGPCSASVEPS